MLLSFRLSNFKSFGDEQEFSFVHGSYAGPPSHAVAELADQSQPDSESPSEHLAHPPARPWDTRVGTVAGLYGANASGKSNVLKALEFMQSAVRNSFQTWASSDDIPVEPFKLDPRMENEPSLFEVVFVINGTRYQYGFRVTAKRVVGEWLYVYPTSRRQIWFERDISADEQYYFGKNFPGRNRIISDLTRPNSLFLSAAVANNHKRVDILDHWFSTHLRFVTPDNRLAREQYTGRMTSRTERWRQIIELLKFADLGICAARVRKEEITSPDREGVLRAFRSVIATVEGEVPSDREALEALNRAARVIEFGHSAGEGKQPVYLPIASESLGTRVWFSLIGPVLRAINNRDTLLVDEIDASLHPQLTSEILKIFRDPQSNPKQAQILFTTHDTALLGTLLGERELSRDQIWFAQKNHAGQSAIYPLTDFAPRKFENLERGYLQGRYGAIPYLDEGLLEAALRLLDRAERHEISGGDEADEAEQDNNILSRMPPQETD